MPPGLRGITRRRCGCAHAAAQQVVPTLHTAEAASQLLLLAAVTAMVAAMKLTTRWTRAVAEALFADEAGPPPAERLDWLCDDFEDFVAHAGPRAELLLRGALAIATWAAPLSIGRRPPLERLSIAERCEALEKTEATAAGLPMLALKAMLCFMYFEHPDARADIGVDVDCFEEQP